MFVMKFYKKLLFSSFVYAFVIGARAQTSDGYVYETHVLTTADFTIPSNSVSGSCENKPNATYKLTTNDFRSGGPFVLDKSAWANNGIVVTKSSGILKSLVLSWDMVLQTNDNTLVAFYGSNAAFTAPSSLSSMTGESVIQAKQCTFDINNEYRYWGIKNISDKSPAYLSNITVTWQLVHFRENLTIGNLGTICLPYDVKASDWNDELIPYTIVGKINSSDNTVEALVFEEVKEMKAGVAYLFVPKKTDICLKYYGTEETCPVNSGSGFVGSFENHTFTEEECKGNDIFLLSNNSIRLAGAGAGVGANRAYIKMSEVPEYKETNSSRKLLLSADGYIETGGAPTVVEMLRLLEDMRYKETTSTTK